jgi:ATP-dependent Zn protease
MLFILLFIFNINSFLFSSNTKTFSKEDNLKKIEEKIKQKEKFIEKIDNQINKENENFLNKDNRDYYFFPNDKIKILQNINYLKDNKYLSEKEKKIFEEERDFIINPTLSLFKSFTFGFLNGIFKHIFVPIAITGFIVKLFNFVIEREKKRNIKPFVGDGSITFKDIAGGEKIKEELSDLIEYFKDPDKYIKAGIRPTRGFLFYGSPGTGKTYIVKALANEIGKHNKCKVFRHGGDIPIFIVNSTELVDKYLGESEKNVKNLFEVARTYQPCIIFFDEIDSIVPNRSNRDANFLKGMVNTLLQEIDGIKGAQKIVVIGATNLIENIDPAMLRPGRLEKHIKFSLPQKKERIKIISMYLKRTKKQLEKGLSVEKLAQKMNGYSPAGIEDIINRATAKAFKNKHKEITEALINEIIMEKEYGFKKDYDHTKEDLLITAYHETGHALMQIIQKDYVNQFDNLTIDPRASFLGVSIAREKADYNIYSKETLLASVRVSLAGRIAEEIIFNNKQTAGAVSDLEKATNIIRDMIQAYGMGNRLLVTRNKERRLSNEEEIEAENILQKCYKETREFLTKHIKLLDAVVEELMVRKTLYEGDIKRIIKDYELKIGQNIVF